MTSDQNNKLNAIYNSVVTVPKSKSLFGKMVRIVKEAKYYKDGYFSKYTVYLDKTVIANYTYNHADGEHDICKKQIGTYLDGYVIRVTLKQTYENAYVIRYKIYVNDFLVTNFNDTAYSQGDALDINVVL